MRRARLNPPTCFTLPAACKAQQHALTWIPRCRHGAPLLQERGHQLGAVVAGLLLEPIGNMHTEKESAKTLYQCDLFIPSHGNHNIVLMSKSHRDNRQQRVKSCTCGLGCPRSEQHQLIFAGTCAERLI